MPIEACLVPSGYVPDATDCDDDDANAHPGADDGYFQGPPVRAGHWSVSFCPPLYRPAEARAQAAAL